MKLHGNETDLRSPDSASLVANAQRDITRTVYLRPVVSIDIGVAREQYVFISGNLKSLGDSIAIRISFSLKIGGGVL